MHSLPRTEALIQDGISSGLHIGAQVAVSLKAEIVADIAIGESRPDIAMLPDTLMPWLSCTKPFGSVIAGQLIEKGILGLDDPVSHHLPAFAAQGKGGITVRHLLTHTGGFRLVELDWLTDSWDEIMEIICAASLEPGWVPGQKAGYHKDTSWYILAEILERLTDVAYADLIRKRILEPLGMEDSWIVLNEDRYRAYGDRMGILQDTRRSNRDPISHLDWDTESGAGICRPGGGGRGPARELVRLYEMLLSGGEWGGHRVISSDTARLLTTRHREGMFDDTFRHKVDWGLGFILESNRYGPQTIPYGFGLHASPNAFGHGGQQSSAAFADPQHGLAVAIIANGTPGEPRHNKRARELHTAIYEDLGLA